MGGGFVDGEGEGDCWLTEDWEGSLSLVGVGELDDTAEDPISSDVTRVEWDDGFNGVDGSLGEDPTDELSFEEMLNGVSDRVEFVVEVNCDLLW